MHDKLHGINMLNKWMINMQPKLINIKIIKCKRN